MLDMEESLTPVAVVDLQARTAVRNVVQAPLREVCQALVAAATELRNVDQAVLTAALTAVAVVFW